MEKTKHSALTVPHSAANVILTAILRSASFSKRVSYEAHPLIWKLDFIHIQIKLIFLSMVVHQPSLWQRGTRQPWNGLLVVHLWKCFQKHFSNFSNILFNQNRKSLICFIPRKPELNACLIEPLGSWKRTKNYTIKFYRRPQAIMKAFALLSVLFNVCFFVFLCHSIVYKASKVPRKYRRTRGWFVASRRTVERDHVASEWRMVSTCVYSRQGSTRRTTKTIRERL